MKKIIIIFCLFTVQLFARDTGTQDGNGSLEGLITDAQTKQPLTGANVVLLDTQLGAASGENGEFIIEKIPAGIYAVKVSLIGYESKIKTNILISSNRVTRTEFEINPVILESKDAIEVSADYFNKDAAKPVSAKRLTARDIQSSPGTGEDIFRILKSMPGVSIAGTRSANLIVRGGSPDENLTLLDNLEISSPLHFSRQDAAMGIISIVNPNLIKNVEFITGGFPAEYGDKMSSVFEINLKEGNHTSWNTDVNINMGGFQTQLDGPLPGKGNMIFSVRRGIFDLITQMMDRPVSPGYWDIVGKATYELGSNNKISLVGFYYKDDVERKESIDDHGDLARKYEYAKWNDDGGAIGINWRHLINSEGYMLTTLQWSEIGKNSWMGSNADPDKRGDDIKENSFRIKSEITYQLSGYLETKGGIFYKTVDPDRKTWSEADTIRTGMVRPAYSFRYNPASAARSGSFIQMTLFPAGRFTITTGLRFDYNDYTKESKFSPRLGMVYRLTNKTTLTAAYGHFYQSPSAYQLSLSPSNTGLKSSRAIHYIAGIEHLLTPDTKVSMEVYYKELDNAFTDSDTTFVITNKGSGYAQGIEFNIQKKMTKNFIGSLAYTYSGAKRKNGKNLPEYYFDYDRRHNLTLTAGYKLSNKWQVGLKYQYATGNPYTPIIGSTQKTGEWYVVEGKHNSARYPDYHSLDFRIDRYFHFSNWTMNLFLDVWNTYNRENIIDYYYDVDENGKIARGINPDFGIMPIFGISAQF